MLLQKTVMFVSWATTIYYSSSSLVGLVLVACLKNGIIKSNLLSLFILLQMI